MSNTTSYSNGMLYEALIRRATKKIEKSSSLMTNLIDSENGESWVSRLPKVEKQFEKVQKNLIKALDKMLKWKLTENERIIIAQQRIKLDSATNSNSLLEIINACLDASQRFKEF